MANSLTENSTENWIELSDDNSSTNHHTNCSVTLSYNGAGVSVFYNLPVYPDDVSNSITTNYASYDIIGRPGQISAYNSTGDQTTSFTLHMHRELKTDGNSFGDDNHIDKIVSLIEAAQYPLIDTGGQGEYAPIVTYKFGDTLIRGKQANVSTKWSGTKINGKYMEVTINISVTNLASHIIDYSDILNSNPRGQGRW